MGAFGLKTHIWNNNMASIVLLAMFPVLIGLLTYAFLVIWAGMEGYDVPQGLAYAAAQLPMIAPFAALAAAAWFGVAWVGNQAMINASVGSHSLSRSDAPELYNMVENLCIARGMPMPKLRIIETEAMNAFASGLSEKSACMTFTRGLLNRLNAEEVEAVAAHELTHIRNKDVRLLVIAVIFVGIISFAAQLVARSMFYGGMHRAGRSRRGGGGNAGALILIAMAILALAYVLAILIRFAMSRKREYLADAGSVELTKNPDAMISALQKISGQEPVEEGAAEVREMFIYNRSTGFAGMFTTHPPIEKRIAALVEFAGGRVRPVQAEPAASGDDGPWGARPKGPWG